jgi:hypothetical protein
MITTGFVENAWYSTSTIMSDGNCKSYVNGGLEGENANTPTLKGTPVLICIGGIEGASYWHDSYISEVILYSSALSDANRQAVEAYLNDKWSVY